MSVHDSPTDLESAGTETTGPALRRCASYMGCRYCEEGSLVYDPETESSRCTACGAED